MYEISHASGQYTMYPINGSSVSTPMNTFPDHFHTAPSITSSPSAPVNNAATDPSTGCTGNDTRLYPASNDNVTRLSAKASAVSIRTSLPVCGTTSVQVTGS